MLFRFDFDEGLGVVCGEIFGQEQAEAGNLHLGHVSGLTTGKPGIPGYPCGRAIPGWKPDMRCIPGRYPGMLQVPTDRLPGVTIVSWPEPGRRGGTPRVYGAGGWMESSGIVGIDGGTGARNPGATDVKL